MRHALLFAFIISTVVPLGSTSLSANECTGDTCSAPVTQSAPPSQGGGRDCEREKKEESVS